MFLVYRLLVVLVVQLVMLDLKFKQVVVLYLVSHLQVQLFQLVVVY